MNGLQIVALIALALIVWAIGAVYRYRKGIWPDSHGPAAGGN